MKQEKITIPNKLGMHARSAASFAKTATAFKSSIEVAKDHVKADGKSIMELLTISAAMGTEITIRVSGEDEDLALTALAKLVKEGFGESM
jgi:phosphocarrier protein HPr